jgi:DNA (cytosine-5)-methyltransferase 1
VTRKILVADLFCGAGGSSTGAERALNRLGLEMELVCVNHWGTALETHQRNHPRARHYCAGYLDGAPAHGVPGRLSRHADGLAVLRVSLGCARR